MTSFNKKLAAAKKIQRPFEDVTVALRADVADKRAELDARREDIETRFAQAQAAALNGEESSPDDFAAELTRLEADVQALDVEESDSLVTLRFWELSGEEWAEITVRHPARPGVLIDMPYGYDMHAVARDAAQTNGRVIEDGKRIKISDQQWADLWEQLPGRSFSAIVDAVYSLNEYAPEKRVERLKKASSLRSATGSD